MNIITVMVTMYLLILMTINTLQFYMKRLLIYLFLLLPLTVNVFGQSAGDWRTRNSGNWDDTNVWQTYDGSSWNSTTAYPGQSAYITNNITIRGHTITATMNIEEEDGYETLLKINPPGTLNLGSYYISGTTDNITFHSPDAGYNKLTVNGVLTANSTSAFVNADTFNIGQNGHFRTEYVGSSGGWWGNSYPGAVGKDNFNGLFEFAGTNHVIPDYSYKDIDISGSADIPSGTRTIDGVLNVSGTLTNAAIIDLGDSLIVSGSFTNSAQLNLDGHLVNSGSLTNTGTIYLAEDMTNEAVGQITTQDTINFKGGLINDGTIASSGAAVFNFQGANDTIAGTGTFPSSNLNILVGYGSKADYRVTTASEITAYNMRVYGNDTLELNPATKLTVTNTLTINNNGPAGIRIHSNASSSGSVIANNTAGAGLAEYRRYMTGAQWHIMSSPLPGETIGSGFITNNSDSLSYKSATSDYAMATYDEAGGGWTAFYQIGEIGTMTAGQGFLGRRDNPGTLTFTGDLSTSNVNIGIDNTTNGWNSVGNPFTSAIGITADASTTPDDFLTVNSAQLDPSYAALYIFDPATPTYYKVLNNSGSGGGYIDQDYLLPGQGFLVKAKTGGGTISFTPAMQVHMGTESYYKKSARSNYMWPTITLFVKSADKEAYTDIKFRDDMTTGLDITYDAAVFGSDPNLAVYSKLLDGSDGSFAIQCVSDASSEPLIIPLGVNCPNGGVLAFSSLHASLLPGQEVILEDRTTGQFTDLLFEGSEYNITVPPQTSGMGRFYLHTSNENVLNSDLNKINELSIFAVNKQIYIDGLIKESCKAYLYDMTGRLAKQFALYPSYNQVLSADEMMNGVYVLTIKDESRKQSEKILLN